MEAIHTNHQRAPDLYCARRGDSLVGKAGVTGRAFLLEAEGLPAGAGNHGGCHREEMRSFAAMRGNLFRDEFVSEIPSSIVDIAPTVLSLLGIPQPPSMTGRALKEAFAGSHWKPNRCSEQTIEAGNGEYRQVLRRQLVDEYQYIESAERES